MSNRLATLYDVCKGRKYSKGNKLFLKVSGLAEAGVPQRQRESKGQRKKTQNTSAGLFTADLSALTRESSEAMPLLKDCCQICGLQSRKPISESSVAH